MRYEVGDIVTIRPDLRREYYEMDDGTSSTPTSGEMLDLAGYTAQIVQADTDDDGDFYKINLDGELWYWVDEMFVDGIVAHEPLTPKGKEYYRYKVGDTVQIIPDLEVGQYPMGDGTRRMFFGPAMVSHRGETTVITEISNGYYHVEIDNNMFFWTDEMFVNTDPINESAIPLEDFLK